MIRKIRIRNFKSIQDETVEFANPLFLVGRNGSGKSNFADALAFVADCMAMPLQTAYQMQVLMFNAFRLSQITFAADGWQMPPVEIHIDFEEKEAGRHGYYSFALSSRDRRLGSVEVTHEECSLTSDEMTAWFRRDEGSFQSSLESKAGRKRTTQNLLSFEDSLSSDFASGGFDGTI